jgi:hypothetical protein
MIRRAQAHFRQDFAGTFCTFLGETQATVRKVTSNAIDSARK